MPSTPPDTTTPGRPLRVTAVQPCWKCWISCIIWTWGGTDHQTSQQQVPSCHHHLHPWEGHWGHGVPVVLAEHQLHHGVLLAKAAHHHHLVVVMMLLVGESVTAILLVIIVITVIAKSARGSLVIHHLSSSIFHMATISIINIPLTINNGPSLSSPSLPSSI